MPHAAPLPQCYSVSLITGEISLKILTTLKHIMRLKVDQFMNGFGLKVGSMTRDKRNKLIIESHFPTGIWGRHVAQEVERVAWEPEGC